MTEFRIEIADVVHRDQVLRTIVSAFKDDPFLRHLFPTEEEYAQYAPSFFGSLFDKRVGAGTVWMVDDAVSVALWDGPGVTEEVHWDLPRAVHAKMAAYDELVHGAFPEGRHWYLGVLATDPPHAGRGLGRAVMRSGLARAAAEGLPAFLETTNAGNVGLYERAGWRTVATFDEPLPVWVMRQDPDF